MKQPLYALLIAPDSKMRQAILDGTKKISICEGHRNYPVGGKIMLCCHLEPWAVMADITRVCQTTLWKVTEEDYMADGFESLDKFFRGMQKFYPNISMGSPVTIINWDNVSGALVKEFSKKTKETKALNQALCEVLGYCIICKERPASWARKTQFSGEHFFCNVCAIKEKDFGQEDSSYFYWIKLE